MSDPLFAASDDAATPLSPEEQAQITPTYITTRAQLNEAEQLNITEADLWAITRKRNILSEAFLKNLHKRMFRRVWKWAGTFRASERNIGIEPYRIPSELRRARRLHRGPQGRRRPRHPPAAGLRAILIAHHGEPNCSRNTVLPSACHVDTLLRVPSPS